MEQEELESIGMGFKGTAEWLRYLKPGWDGEKALAISESAIQTMEKIAAAFRHHGMKDLQVVPRFNGGILMQWGNDIKDPANLIQLWITGEDGSLETVLIGDDIALEGEAVAIAVSAWQNEAKRRIKETSDPTTL